MGGITLVAATNNQRKLDELGAFLLPPAFECVSMGQLGITSEPDETGGSFRENATIKARALYEICRRPVISDDSGLMVDWLHGAPGIYSARYAGPAATGDENIDKLLEQLAGTTPEQRTARFVCVICVILDERTTLYATGHCEGFIGHERRGRGGFGYDPVFWIKGNRSFAQLSEQHKNQISHRGRAMRKMIFRLGGIHSIRTGPEGI